MSSTGMSKEIGSQRNAAFRLKIMIFDRCESPERVEYSISRDDVQTFLPYGVC